MMFKYFSDYFSNFFPSSKKTNYFMAQMLT